MSNRPSRPLLVVISAPSGAGKTTLGDRLLADHPWMVRSVSCTTRSPRGCEVDGRDYRFVTRDRFQEIVAAGGFLEHAEVHGNWYGTPLEGVLSRLRQDTSVLLIIDVQGAAQVREHIRGPGVAEEVRRGFVDVFVKPPSMDALRARLAKRGEDGPEVIEQRLRNAALEMAAARDFRYVLTNDDLEAAYARLKEIVHEAAQRAG